MTSDPWNPGQYHRFREERRQPFFDLLALVRPMPDMHIVDLGCGTGELTSILHQELKAKETEGIDSSETMLTKARPLAGDGLRFELGDINIFSARRPYDLVFSNAALHWVSDHRTLLKRLSSGIAEGGQLAVQVPANYHHPAHRLAGELAGESPFREALGGFRFEKSVLEPEEYATLLNSLHFRRQQVRLQVYVHYLNSREDVVEWVKGTTLTAYQRRMPAGVFSEFVNRYRSRLFDHFEDVQPFFFPLNRILFWAQR